MKSLVALFFIVLLPCSSYAFGLADLANQVGEFNKKLDKKSGGIQVDNSENVIKKQNELSEENKQYAHSEECKNVLLISQNTEFDKEESKAIIGYIPDVSNFLSDYVYKNDKTKLQDIKCMSKIINDVRGKQGYGVYGNKVKLNYDYFLIKQYEMAKEIYESKTTDFDRLQNGYISAVRIFNAITPFKEDVPVLADETINHFYDSAKSMYESNNKSLDAKKLFNLIADFKDSEELARKIDANIEEEKLQIAKIEKENKQKEEQDLIDKMQRKEKLVVDYLSSIKNENNIIGWRNIKFGTYYETALEVLAKDNIKFPGYICSDGNWDLCKGSTGSVDVDDPCAFKKLSDQGCAEIAINGKGYDKNYNVRSLKSDKLLELNNSDTKISLIFIDDKFVSVNIGDVALEDLIKKYPKGKVSEYTKHDNFTSKNSRTYEVTRTDRNITLKLFRYEDDKILVTFSGVKSVRNNLTNNSSNFDNISGFVRITDKNIINKYIENLKAKDKEEDSKRINRL